jgi:transposase
LSTGIQCLDNYQSRGVHCSEKKLPHLEKDIREIVDPDSQADPNFKSVFAYTRVTAKSIRQSLIDEKWYTDEQLPTERTINNLLNRLGYRLKRVQKTKPLKKISQVDEIFDNVKQANQEADNNPSVLRISIDTKTVVKIGEYCRGGQTRDIKVPKAWDHDTIKPDTKLIPFGVLDVFGGFLTIIFGNSSKTSDFIVDALILWWENHKAFYPNIKELAINLDNGPESNSHRTPFIKRIQEFANTTALSIPLIYSPPYHSKYNPIERCWAVLENNWNGTLIDTVDKALKWATTMTWKGIKSTVELLVGTYEKWIKLKPSEMQQFEQRLKRSDNLPKWDVRIEPQMG